MTLHLQSYMSDSQRQLLNFYLSKNEKDIIVWKKRAKFLTESHA